jgi:tetratricopeptide (TPR) repeat protein
MKTLRALALALATAGLLNAALAQGLRPEVGKPLQQAGELLKAGKAREALAKVREAEAVGGRTAAEQLTIDRMKGAAAQRAGDNATAVQALEAVFNKVSGAEQAQTAEQLAFAYSQLKDWAKSQQWATKAQQLGSNSAQLKQLTAYLQSQSGDYTAIARDAAAAIAASEQAGRRPEEGDLLRLADAQQRTGATNAYIVTLEKLLANYPKKDYWSAYLGRLTRKSGFSQGLGLDVLRLRLASGTLDKTDDFMEMAQLALQAGFPAEGVDIVDKGFASKALGTGPEAERHQRLKDLAVKRNAEKKASIAADATAAAAEKTGDALVEVGYAYVTMGQVDQGIKLMEQGIAKGNLKRPEQARLHLGMAQIQSPALKAKGLQTLRSLKGTDGVAEVGRLWTVLAR